MITVQDGVLAAIGLIACFAGYSMFQGLLPAWGFILGGWITYTFLPVIVGPAQAENVAVLIVGVLIGGVIGAAVAAPAYYLIIFLSGAALGMIVGVLFGTLIDVGGISTIGQLTSFTDLAFPPTPQTAMQYLFGGIGALVLGGLSFSFQKFMICAASAFLGATAVITGLGGSFLAVSGSDMGHSATMITAWIILGFVGLYVQFRMMGEV